MGRIQIKLRTFQLSVIALLIFLLPLVFWPTATQVFEMQKFLLFIVLGSVLFCFFGISVWRKEIRVRVPDLFVLLGAFLFIGIVSSLLSSDINSAMLGSPVRHFGVLTWVYLVVFAFVIYSLNISKKELEKFIVMPLLAAGIIQVFLAIAQALQPGILFPQLNLETFVGRSFGTMGHPNFLAQFLLVPFFVSISIKDRSKYLVTILLFVGIILTQSRGAIVALVLGGIFFVLYGKKYWKQIVGSGALIGLIAFIMVLFIPADSISSLFGERSGSVYGRVNIWQTSIAAIADKPFIGYGFENFLGALAPYVPTELSFLEGDYKMVDRAHNIFVYMLTTTGLLGTLFFVFWIVGTFLHSNKNVRFLAGFFALLIAWQFSFPVITDAVMFFLLWALLVPRKA